MASGNVELLRSVYDAWARGDWSSADWADPEIEFVAADGPTRERAKGLAELAETWRSFPEAWAEWRVEPEEYLELDQERVLVLINLSGRGRTSGLDVGQMQAKGANLFHLRDGKVTRLTLYWDRERAFADAGLSPG